jgi:hypothetical protein
MRRFVMLRIYSSAVKINETMEKNTAIEVQDLEENVFGAFVVILTQIFSVTKPIHS